VLSAAASSTAILQKPEGAWTHAVWKKAFPKQSAGVHRSGGYHNAGTR
jgi:hypothetical protein